MDFNELFEVLRHTIQCRQCGGSGAGGLDPCGTCIGSGIEAVSDFDKVIEDKVVVGLRSQVLYGGFDFIDVEIKEV